MTTNYNDEQMGEADAWARFSEESNALDYLLKTVEFISRAQATPTDWKWVIISLHGALYGFMICALKGTDPDNVMREVRDGKHLISSERTNSDTCFMVAPLREGFNRPPYEKH